ncbi:MAG: NAD(P)-dependent oxidoreductase [Candidatus Margulisbacteria bacterium]|nr:NAD(P)-dependent oxidoreductase [Candidatus Margulisiibacteriota bacterium]
MVENIFITGSTGCVGHYLVEQFANKPQYKMYLLIRDKKRFLLDIDAVKNAELIVGDVEKLDSLAPLLKQMDHVIHIATSWCGSKECIIEAPLKLLELLDHKRVKKIIFFSTASILGRGNKPLKEAGEIGTSYIKDKYQSYLAVQSSKYKDKVIHVFPTVIVGGDRTHPFTHISQGLKEPGKYLKWLKYFYIDLGFHFIHARDIAEVMNYMLENEVKGNNFVLGNDYILLKDFIKQCCDYYKIKTWIRIKIPTGFIKFIIKFFRIKVDPWGYFSLNYKFFHYDTVNCRVFKIPTMLYNIQDILKQSEK